jgi:NitT/TauT family transport system permease protein
MSVSVTSSYLPTSQLFQRAKKIILHPLLASIVSFLVIWWIVSLLVSAEDVLPSPLNVGKEMGDMILYGNVLYHSGATLVRITGGWTVAMFLGVGLGILMGANNYMNSVLRDFIIVDLVMPGLVWAVIAVIWFGGNIMASIVAVSMISFPTVVVNTYEGVKNIEKELVDMARVYGIKKSSILRKIILPSLTPFIVASARQAFAQAWKVISLVELFGTSNGIGYEIRSAYDRFSVEGILSWTIVFSIIILLIEHGIFGPVQRYILRWRPEIGEI